MATAIALAMPLVAAPRPAQAGTGATQAPKLKVGDELVALRDVTLRQATIAKGSRVKVVAVTENDGEPVSLALELKDGHVLRDLPYRKVRDDFRPAS